MAITTDTTTIPGATILIDSAAEGIAIDYTPFYERIATALETIATNSTIIKNSLSSISSNIGTVANNTTTLTNLGAGAGIHTIGPYDWLGYASLYHSAIEQGGALDTTDNVPAEQQEQSLKVLKEYLAKLQSLPTMY